MIKKLIYMAITIIMCFGLFVGCNNNGNSKIDIGGETPTGKPMASTAVRIVLDNDTFKREDKIKLVVGFGFPISQPVLRYKAEGSIIKLTIDANKFTIINEENTEVDNLYERIFDEYLEEKFVCTQKKKRYIPNYYETFELMLNSDAESFSGSIRIKAILHFGDDGLEYSGQQKSLFYAINSNKIAFSAKSITDAQKKI